ncbi:unnamed protein product [Trichogramma brassicae]|uniref:Uncharacterized protein n=1 Tax=Trichogramma brassicae TaxID=86971 RepID=A0A6H5I7B0_9HYME|nr:unnamed protein product [Trichogramma brassicae]
MLMEQQSGFTKYPCFKCLWNSRDRKEHYTDHKWSERNSLESGHHNVINSPTKSGSLYCDTKPIARSFTMCHPSIIEHLFTTIYSALTRQTGSLVATTKASSQFHPHSSTSWFSGPTVVSGDGASTALSGGHHQKDSGGSSDGQGCPCSLPEGVLHRKPGREDEQAEGLIQGLAGYVKDRKKPAIQLQTFSPCLTWAFAALKRTMKCTEAPSSQEAVVAASTPFSTRNKIPATSPPEVAAANKRANGPHLYEQAVDANKNAVVSEETFTVVKGRRG